MAKIEKHFEYTNESFSGCDMIATINIPNTSCHKTIGEIQTISYSIYMDKSPIRSIGNVNAKDYVIGQRTIAGSLVFSLFNKHFSQEIMEEINSEFRAGTAYLVDELPPFDLIISAANEYGYRSRCVIYGVRLLNEGQVMSINDIYTENTYQFMATDLEYFTDELSYAKNKNGRGYILSDNINYGTSVNFSHIFKNEELTNYINEQINLHYEALKQKNIILKYGIKQPTSNKDNSLINFFINPGIQKGSIIIVPDDQSQKNRIISLIANTKSNQYNSINHAEISLPLGKYTVYVEDIENGRLSNKVSINVRQFGVLIKDQPEAPLIENITSESFDIINNVNSHNKVMIIKQDGTINNYDIETELTIDDLDENTYYTIKTYNNIDREYSKSIQIKTADEENKLFKELKKYLKANKKKLNISHKLNECFNIIDKYKENKLTPAACINKAYNKFKAEYRALDVGDDNYREDKEKLEEKIKLCQILYETALKLTNDNNRAINIEKNVPPPTMFYDDNLNNVFQFDENITSAEIFKLYKNVVQFDSVIYSSDFKTICNKNNCYRFTGKPGKEYYIRAINGQVRSTKLYFTVLSNEEKMIYLNNKHEEMNNTDINKIQENVENALGKSLSELNKQRAFMYNAKKISSPLLISPSIIYSNKNIEVETSLYDFYSNCTTEINLYLAISSYDDLIQNNDIYKIPFNNHDEKIYISNLYNGLKNNTAYAIWIENEDGIQISNPSTFIYSLDINEEYINDDINAYELNDFINNVLLIANNNLSKDEYENISDNIENVSEINSIDIIPLTFDAISDLPINKKILLHYIYNMKYYIGLFTDSDTTLIYNINYYNNNLSFNSLKKGSIVIYNKGTIQNFNLERNNTISFSRLNGLIIVVVLDDTLYNKSDIIIINKKENYMEVE